MPYQYVKICPLPCHWGIARRPGKDTQSFISPIPHGGVTHTRCCRQPTLFMRVTSHTWAPEYGDSQKRSGFTLANLARRKVEPVRVPAAVWRVTWWNTWVRFQPAFLSLWESLSGFPESSAPLLPTASHQLFSLLFLSLVFIPFSPQWVKSGALCLLAKLSITKDTSPSNVSLSHFKKIF